jgi:hypothetical protein
MYSHWSITAMDVYKERSLAKLCPVWSSEQRAPQLQQRFFDNFFELNNNFGGGTIAVGQRNQRQLPSATRIYFGTCRHAPSH